MSRRLTAGCALFVGLVGLASVAEATASVKATWGTRADAVCLAWDKKYANAPGAHPVHKPPTTLDYYRYFVGMRPLLNAEIHALTVIPGRRPAGSRAISLAKISMHEVDAVTAAYRAHNQARFQTALHVWVVDTRASSAFKAAGAVRCG